ncbi:hypothetical protein B7463_g3745, partial [Scytalidium lignicola]
MTTRSRDSSFLAAQPVRSSPVVVEEPSSAPTTPSSFNSVASSHIQTGIHSPSDPQIKSELREQPDMAGSMQNTGDGDEIFVDVDDSYEGMAEDEDGVEYFICEGLKVKQIPQATVVQRTLGDLYSISHTPYMNLDPEYQRDIVWDENRASLLITSIITGYFVPPIIFNVSEKMERDPNTSGRKVRRVYRVCVDGKQRLTSVKKFMDGLIGFYDSDHPPKKWYYRHPIVDGEEKLIANHHIMPDAMKEFFRSRTFCCWEYKNLSLETEENMFQLVQRGIPLTPAEKMRAMSTEWAKFTKKYEDDYSIIINLSKQSRASGFRLVLTIFTMIQEVMARPWRNGTTPSLQASPQALLRVLEDKAPMRIGLKMKFKQIFDKYESLIKMCSTKISLQKSRINRNSPFDPAPDYLREAGVGHVRTFSPLELIATAILIAYYTDTRDANTLLEDIKQMRQYLREVHKDLRVNAQCWASVWEYISVVLPQRHLEKASGAAAHPSDRTVNGDGIAGLSLDPSATAASAAEAGSRNKQRKRINARDGKARRRPKRRKS